MLNSLPKQHPRPLGQSSREASLVWQVVSTQWLPRPVFPSLTTLFLKYSFSSFQWPFPRLSKACAVRLRGDHFSAIQGPYITSLSFKKAEAQSLCRRPGLPTHREGTRGRTGTQSSRILDVALPAWPSRCPWPALCNTWLYLNFLLLFPGCLPLHFWALHPNLPHTGSRAQEHSHQAASLTSLGGFAFLSGPCLLCLGLVRVLKSHLTHRLTKRCS